MPIYTEYKLFNPAEEFKALCEREYEDNLEAKIALASFEQMVNASGYRGRYPAKVIGNQIIAC